MSTRNRPRWFDRHSLRWRLPLLGTTLIIAVLATFFWAAHEQADHTLIETGRTRTQAAADQLVTLLAPPMRQRTEELKRVAADAALRNYLEDQTQSTRQAAETGLKSLVATGTQVVELWDGRGTRLLALSQPPAIENTFPATSPPAGQGLRLARSEQGLIVSQQIEPVQHRDDGAGTANVLGYLVLRRPVSTSPSDLLNRLVGGGAQVALGSTSGSWTNLTTLVDPPPVDLSRMGLKEYRSATGEARVGALAEITGTPWLLWVEFPRSAFLAPAHAFLWRMIPVGIGFVVMAAVLSGIATGRITKRLAALTEASEAIAAGDYGRRVSADRQDEIGRLGMTFNAMVGQIQLTQERLMLAMRGSNVGIWEWTDEINQFVLSPEWKHLLGYGENELNGSPFLMRQLVHPDDLNAVTAGIRACLKGETDTWESEHRLRRKDGTYLWVLAHGVPNRNSAGQVVRFAGTAVDITPQKAAQAEALAQARQAEFVAAVAVALTEGRELRDMLGRCAEAMVQHLDAAIARIWTANFSEQVLELHATAGAIDGDSTPTRVPLGDFTIGQVAMGQHPRLDNAVEGLRFVSKDIIQREGLNSYAAFPLVVGDQLVGVMSMFARQALTESTLIALGSVARTVALGIERKRLEESRSRFEDLLESAPDFVTIGQPDGPALYINRAARTALGIGATEHVPSLLAFRPPEFQELFDTVVIPSALRDGNWKGEAEYVARSGRIIPVSQVTVVHKTAAGEIGYISTISRDISHERKAACEREELEDQLRRAQKIEAIGQLAGGLAHDFNNLLTIILSYSNMLASQLHEGDARWEDIDQIRKAGTRAAQLTRQLLAFSRKQILHPIVLDPNELVQGISPMLARLLGEDIELVLHCPPNVSAITFDPAQLELILVNLAANARDAMPQGGRFTIETANVDLDEEFSRTHLAVEPGHYVRLSLSDTGIGMDDATKKRIFEPFFTTKPTGKGTGLGLATVFGIVKQSGGSIWVYSEPGLGASFKIFLPIAKDSKALQTAHAPRHVPPGRETVLVVEDETAVRLLVQKVLTSAGYTILSAAHPADAIRIASDPNQRIDLLVTDVVMPDLNGAALSLRLRETRPTLPVLFMSGFADDAIEHHGVLQAGTPFLQKPFTGPDLACMVREVLDRALVSG